MSTYYLNVNMISRGKGQSAVASVAYRSGENLYSELDMENKSYKARSVQPDVFIQAPKQAPEWVYNREKLWNEVEWRENKSNSQLAREVRVALPIEFDNDIQKKLLSEYVNENFVSRGMVADVSIHRDVEHNPHAHIMLTVRPFDENGDWGAKQKREYLKNENGTFIFKENGAKKHKRVDLTDWDRKETLLEWRKNYAEKVNHYYKDFGINERVSHESYEKQGLDKIPKHRLNRTEYTIEKNEKERAKEDGLIYKPKTFYAKLNQRIEKANYDIDRFNEKIADLYDRQKSVNSIISKELIELRKNRTLSQSDWISLKTMSKMANSNVNVNSTKDNLIRLNHWKQKLNREKEYIAAFGNTIEKSKRVYKDNPKDVMMYGFIPNKFEQEYQIKLKQHEEEIKKYSKKINAYNELNKHSVRAYDIQRMFTNEEFAFLYPDYAGKLSDNEKAMQLKYTYIENFRKDGSLSANIPEIDNDLSRYQDNYVLSEGLLNRWKETINSLVILERMKAKQQREYKEQYQGNWDSKSVFDKSVQYSSTSEQIKFKENYKEVIENNINEHLKTLYPRIDDNILEQIPSQSKSRLLELCINEKATGRLSKDLRIIEKEIKSDLQENDQENKNDNFHQSNYGNASMDTGGLFSMLVNNVQHNEVNKDDLERKRQKDKKRISKVTKKRIGIEEYEL